MIRVVCACGRKFKAEDQHAGKDTKCPECGADLIIGPAPVSTSSGGDADEVPGWWYPGDPTARAERATAPTRSGSDPGADAVNTKILPPGYIPKPQASSQSPPAGLSTRGQVPPPKAPAGGFPTLVPGPPSRSVQENLDDLRRDHRSAGPGRWSDSLAPVTQLLAQTRDHARAAGG